jgi:chaperonin cofactor prefoldin
LEEKELKTGGFLFSTEKDYNDAKQEEEAIKYLQANTDLTNSASVLKLYNKLTENRTFHTPVGYTFLKELRDTIINNTKIKQEDLDTIYIPALNYNPNSEQNSLLLKHFKEVAEKTHTRNRNLGIINLFLAITIIVMIGIAIYSDKTTFSNYEKSVINKYEAWEESLNKRQQSLDEQAAELNEEYNNANNTKDSNSK